MEKKQEKLNNFFDIIIAYIRCIPLREYNDFLRPPDGFSCQFLYEILFDASCDKFYFGEKKDGYHKNSSILFEYDVKSKKSTLYLGTEMDEFELGINDPKPTETVTNVSPLQMQKLMEGKKTMLELMQMWTFIAINSGIINEKLKLLPWLLTRIKDFKELSERIVNSKAIHLYAETFKSLMRMVKESSYCIHKENMKDFFALYEATAMCVCDNDKRKEALYEKAFMEIESRQEELRKQVERHEVYTKMSKQINDIDSQFWHLSMMEKLLFNEVGFSDFYNMEKKKQVEKEKNNLMSSMLKKRVEYENTITQLKEEITKLKNVKDDDMVVESKDKEDMFLCKICYDHTISIITGCRHAYCEKCAESARKEGKCFFCRQETTFDKIYI